MVQRLSVGTEKKNQLDVLETERALQSNLDLVVVRELQLSSSLAQNYVVRGSYVFPMLQIPTPRHKGV